MNESLTLDCKLVFHIRRCFMCLNRDDVKPGVSMVRRVKEALKKETKQKETNVRNRQKTFKEQEKESREAALQNTISNENKGFALLQKMGYKAGQGLGKKGKKKKKIVPKKRKRCFSSLIVSCSNYLNLCCFLKGLGELIQFP